MSTIEALQKYKTKKKTLFVGAFAAGLLALGFGASGTAAASSYDDYGHDYDNSSYNRSSDDSYDSSYTNSSYYNETVSYTLKYSCDYSDYYQADSYGRWHKWAYDTSRGTWFNCDFYENYDASRTAYQAEEASYSSSSSDDEEYDNESGHDYDHGDYNHEEW